MNKIDLSLYLVTDNSDDVEKFLNTIEEGIEILTGVPAGKKDKNGNFPAGTVNYLAYEKLKKYAKNSEKKA